MARPSADDRRLDYLRVGADLVAEFDLSRASQVPLDALAHIKVAHVAERAGVTKGALYHIWDSQDAFRRDLLAHLLDLEDSVGVHQTEELLGEVSLDDGINPAIDAMASIVFQRARNDPRVLARFSFYNFADDPEVNALLSRDPTSYEPFFQAYLEMSGRQLRSPFTLQHMITLTRALFNGMVLRYRTSPDLVDAEVVGDGEPRSLYPFSLIALLEHLTEPVGDEAA